MYNDIEPNICITIIEKPDIKYSEERVYAYVLKVTKVGKKYIYGNIVEIEDGEREERNWEIKVDTSRIVKLFYGERWDIIERVKEYYNDLNKWRDRRDEFRKAIYSKIQDEVYTKYLKELEEWEKNNPQPMLKDYLTAINA